MHGKSAYSFPAVGGVALLVILPEPVHHGRNTQKWAGSIFPLNFRPYIAQSQYDQRRTLIYLGAWQVQSRQNFQRFINFFPDSYGRIFFSYAFSTLVHWERLSDIELIL